MINRKNSLGLSLIEIVVVMGLFAVLGILTTRAVLLSLQGGQKGEALVKVRENADYAVSVMERQIRNADAVTPCPNTDPKSLVYSDDSGISTSFSCVNIGLSGYIASGSARLTNQDIAITQCSFVCSLGTASSPPQVQINLTATSANAPSAKEGSTISISTKIDLRTY